MDLFPLILLTVLAAVVAWRLKPYRPRMAWIATGFAILGVIYSIAVVIADWQEAKEKRQQAEFTKLAEGIEASSDENWLQSACPYALKLEKEFRDTAAKRGESFIPQPRLGRCRP
jgi:hypothetical protein